MSTLPGLPLEVECHSCFSFAKPVGGCQAPHPDWEGKWNYSRLCAKVKTASSHFLSFIVEAQLWFEFWRLNLMNIWANLALFSADALAYMMRHGVDNFLSFGKWNLFVLNLHHHVPPWGVTGIESNAEYRKRKMIWPLGIFWKAFLRKNLCLAFRFSIYAADK